MSGALQRALWANKHLTATETAVLGRMASHAKKDGTGISPSVEDTASATKYSRRAVFQVIRDAKARDILVADGTHGKQILYRMSMEAIHSYIGALPAPLPVQEVHSEGVQGVQGVHPSKQQSPNMKNAIIRSYKGAGGAPLGVQGVHPRRGEGAFDNPPLTLKSSLLQSSSSELEDSREGGDYIGHREFHQIDGVGGGHDERCTRLQKWLSEHPDMQKDIVNAIESIVGEVEYDPDGGAKIRGGPYFWRYRGPKGLKWYKDIVQTVQTWTRNAGRRNGTGLRGVQRATNTTDAVREARRRVRG